MNIGVFIGRMQPIHIGHQRIIDKSLEENDFTFIVFGSSKIINESNPFTDKERTFFLEIIFKNREDYNILFLEDTSSDEQWLKNLNLLIQEASKRYLKNNIKKLTFYGGDLKKDYAIKVIKDYNNLINIKDIYYKEVSRKEFFISHNGEQILVSSTRVRKELKDYNFEVLEKMLDKEVVNYLKFR